MANALPLLLLGGAAVLMMGGKKKKPGVIGGGQIILPATTPPPLSPAVKKSGSGYPGLSRDQMQEIQTMLMANGYGVGAKGLDGRYGPATKQAVWEFQEDWGQGLTVDGKPGPNTRAALKQAEAGRIDALPASSSDQCDPLDPGTWGSGNVCVFDGSRWVREKAQVKKPAAETPALSGNFDDLIVDVVGGAWRTNERIETGWPVLKKMDSFYWGLRLQPGVALMLNPGDCIGKGGPIRYFKFQQKDQKTGIYWFKKDVYGLQTVHDKRDPRGYLKLSFMKKGLTSVIEVNIFSPSIFHKELMESGAPEVCPGSIKLYLERHAELGW